MKTSSTLTAALALCAASATSAADYPTEGLLTSTMDERSVHYVCAPEGEKLRCDFIDSGIRKMAEPEDEERYLERSREQYRASGASLAPSDCAWVKAQYNYMAKTMTLDEAAAEIAANDKSGTVEGIKKQLEMKAALSTMYGYLKASLKAEKAFCDEPTEAHFLDVERVEFERLTKTCIIHSYASTLYYEWDASFADTGGWIIKSPPKGPCGIVKFAAFFKDRTNSKEWVYQNYQYVQNHPVPSCSKLEEIKTIGFYAENAPRNPKLDCEYMDVGMED